MVTLQRVELGVLGTLQVRQYGLPVTIPGAKPRAILTMLGLHGGSAVPADSLTELLWGTDPPRTAAKALQTHISALRRALGDGFVLTQGAGWTVTATEIDATRYQGAAKAGRDAAAAGDNSQAVAHFDEALRLWRGIPELPDGPRGDAERTRWIESHAGVVEDRADALLATGRAAEIIGELEAAVAEAPLRERRWGHLMLALYRAGRQGEALGAYQRARSLLANDLGVDPGPDLRRLEAAIVTQDDALELPVSQRLSAVTRAVTFLLTDIEGSTAAWEADSAAMATALARHDEIVEQVVTSRAGRLVKTRGEGDATFSVFDRPSAAAAAAVELQEAIRHEPWAPAEPIRIRVALHTGEVELRDGDYFGRAVNRAARLRSLANGGQTLCSGATAELVIDTLADDVVLADLGMRALKNLARPEHVFELRLETADDARAPVSDTPLQRPELPAVLAGPGPFVGRARELEQLLAAWQATLSAGARAVLIAGEPGVGKTRLAGEWSRQAFEQRAVVLYGRCDEDLGAPYQPFAEALRSLVPCLGTDRLRGLRGVEALLTVVPGLTDALPDLAAPPRADPDTERYALFDAVVAVLGIASAEAPVVLILDDLHWAAKPTLLLLRHLLRFGENARVQIVGTYRSTDLDRAHPLAAMLADLHRDGSAVRLALGGLEEDDVSAYVAESGYDDEDLARALASVTGGNPFFLIEALRHVAESGGRWDPSTLPQGVREAVSRRLSRLPAETNKALAAAAVVGSRFALDLVERVVGADLVDAFDEAGRAGIVIEEPGGRYRFNHALVRQSLLAELASVRRMRLHQRIAAVLETEPGAADELLAELAYHYFECAWAGNAAKAVDYCRRAADQAMARLAYEGAAEFYDRALHALEELDDELPGRDDVQAELLVARCEALLTAGDVASATGAVSQLRSAAGDSVRLTAWGTCFDGELSMLTHPERLEEIAAAVGAAAKTLAELQDDAGEAKAHTVRASCLGRLGRVGDCETALDEALTAARRAGDHRRVNAVLAGAPLAALWGPNPVPRAGGRCLDVVRLLRITTGSPVVEATSTRCQAVLDAFRGRAAAGRQLIESARRSLAELGMRHALLEVDQFAGIIELVADDPGAAEPHLRRACDGFRRMGLDADTAETAALLARACLALDREADADELCSESKGLAGDDLKAAIAWRSVRAQLLSLRGAHDEARLVAEEAVALAARTDGLVDHGDACLALATVLGAAGDAAGARAAAERAVELYELKGAAALAEKARGVFGEPDGPTATAAPAAGPDELDNACARVAGQLFAAADRSAWDEVEQLVAPVVVVESHRKIVGHEPVEITSREWSQGMTQFFDVGMVRHRPTFLAVRSDRLALIRLAVGTDDASPGSPRDEFLQIVGLDEAQRISLQVLFDLEDIDAAVAELDARHARLDNACTRVISRLFAGITRDDWDGVTQLYAPAGCIQSRRRIVGFTMVDFGPDEFVGELKRWVREMSAVWHRHTVVGMRGERLALVHMEAGTEDRSPGAPQEEMLQLFGLDTAGRIALQAWFDIEDLDAAVAELDALHARFENSCPRTRLENAASRADARLDTLFAERSWDEMGALIADDFRAEDRRRGLRREAIDRAAELAEMQAIADLGGTTISAEVLAIRGDRLALSRSRFTGDDQWPDAFHTEILCVLEIDSHGRAAAVINFDIDDLDAAFEELDARYLAGEAAPYAQTWSAGLRAIEAANRRELPNLTHDFVSVDHRKARAFPLGEMPSYAHAAWNEVPDEKFHIEAVHRLNTCGAVVTYVAAGTSRQGFDAEWRGITVSTVSGDLINHIEMFDEADLDAALARFDELSRPAPRLENTASRVDAQFSTLFAERRWDEMGALFADDIRAEDRRRGLQREAVGRDIELAEMRAMSDLGVTRISAEVIAVRGERLVLARSRLTGRDQRPDAFHTEIFYVLEIDARELVAAVINFDPDDLDAAFAELESRYLAGEAAPYAHTWSVIADAYDAFNRHEPFPTTPDWVTVDHRLGATIAPGDLTAFISASWAETPNARIYIEAVHRLSEFGAISTGFSRGSSQEGFAAEWREVAVTTVDGDLVSRTELFDETALDAALARFDELSRRAPRLENAASRADHRFNKLFADRRWDEIAAVLTGDIRVEDRRAGLRREAVFDPVNGVAEIKAMADLGVQTMSSVVIATRGDRLALCRTRYSGRDQRPEAFHTEILRITETNADEEVVASIAFDVEDIDAALAELDARHLAGEAAAHAHTWSVITQMYAALNRRELPATTPDWVSIDHQRGRTFAFAPGEITANIRDSWDQLTSGSIYIEVVHRLTNHGAVVTHAAHGTSQEGFDVEWRCINVLSVDGELISRCEMFDDTDLDAALTRFDELSRPAPQLENSASRMYERHSAFFAARDWDAMAAMVADDICTEDRGRVVSGGIRRGRDAQIANMRAVADVGVNNIESSVIATRGDRLALLRNRVSGDQRPEAFGLEMLNIIEIDADNRFVASVLFDLDDLDAAFTETDARYLAGEAAPYANTWSAITQAYVGMTRGELPSTTTDLVTVDHRHVTRMGPEDGITYLRASWDLAPEFKLYVEAVHRLSGRGAVFTRWSNGTSRAGFEAEWRAIDLVTVEGNRISRGEIFDESSVDAALARFDELDRTARRLENPATRAYERLRASFTAGDWVAVAELLTDDSSLDDRRRLVSGGVVRGRAANVAEMRAIADLGSVRVGWSTLATRGARLALVHVSFSRGDQRTGLFRVEAVDIVEIDADHRIAARVAFDPNDLDAALAELDTRYAAGEAASHAHTWSVLTGAFAALNRHEIPGATPDFVIIDHQLHHGTTEPSGLADYLHASWDLTPDLRMYIEVVHELSGLGAVITTAVHGSSREGFDADWRFIELLTREGDLANRCEIFGESDLDAALARFDELSRPTRRPENMASRVTENFRASFAARDWDAMADMLADDLYTEDRRRVVNAGIRHGRDCLLADLRAAADIGVPYFTTIEIATRGERLILARAITPYDGRSEGFRIENLVIGEIGADERIVAQVIFDPDDLDAAFAELDARYLAGEAAPHANTWSVITRAYAATDRHELPTTAPDVVDHRQLSTVEGRDLIASLRTAWALTPDGSVYIHAVHRLNHFGAVVTHRARGTGHGGFDAEWRSVNILMVDGDQLRRCELFDEADLDKALETFDELSRPGRTPKTQRRGPAREW